MLACQFDHLEVARELCERGADVNASMTDDGYTALMFASQKGHLVIVRELCDRGANVNAARTTDGYTALMWASQEGHLAVVRCLLDHGASKTAVNLAGENAYDWVQNGPHKAALQNLLRP
jgi:ankyrin repeat protein